MIRSFPWIALPLLALLMFCVGSVAMTWQQQAAFGALMLGTVLIVSRTRSGRAGTLVMVIFSMCATTRYAMWRIGSLEHYLASPWQAIDRWNALFMVLLVVAEVYSFLILYLGYMQTIAPLRRPPVALPLDIDKWPSIDVMIPTFNEPMNIVCYTVLAAKQMDWPADKLNIWLLDDGGRAEFRDFAKEAGVGYVARPEHNHAKAGNINYALERSSADLVAIFDCDHVPTRSFLQVTAGWFLRDAELGMLQTPHHFYSPDPFERNLGHFREVPNEGELFYGIIQDTNDLWNATFFCGSCAVLRRTAIDQVGGIAHETVTEDAHTSLRMQKLGWNTAYINLPQAGGLATETLADHVKQRVRWARGMAQILRIDNPLFAKGLTLPQRLCYFNAMLHFLYALPRLIFLTAPILYLVFGKLNIPGYWLTILVFAIPHLLLSMVTNSRIQGRKRYSFWNEIYETVLSPYILLPTLFALISPKFGKFNVTAKGQNQEEGSFDSKLARPFMALLALNGLGLLMAIPRYLFWDHAHPGTIAMNCFWTLFNMVVLGVTLSICWEPRQRREAVRVTAKIPIAISSHGLLRSGMLEDLSVGGASAKLDGPWKSGDTVKISFPGEDSESMFSARIVSSAQGRVRLAFEISSVEHQEAITRILFLNADRWLDWNDGRGSDNILR
ncbi:MAG TPA: UDP-forming cellulose synthase catalytic subunit, partial [Acidisarcina sp.]